MVFAQRRPRFRIKMGEQFALPVKTKQAIVDRPDPDIPVGVFQNGLRFYLGANPGTGNLLLG